MHVDANRCSIPYSTSSLPNFIDRAKYHVVIAYHTCKNFSLRLFSFSNSFTFSFFLFSALGHHGLTEGNASYSRYGGGRPWVIGQLFYLGLLFARNYLDAVGALLFGTALTISVSAAWAFTLQPKKVVDSYWLLSSSGWRHGSLFAIGFFFLVTFSARHIHISPPFFCFFALYHRYFDKRAQRSAAAALVRCCALEIIAARVLFYEADRESGRAILWGFSKTGESGPIFL